MDGWKIERILKLQHQDYVWILWSQWRSQEYWSQDRDWDQDWMQIIVDNGLLNKRHSMEINHLFLFYSWCQDQDFSRPEMFRDFETKTLWNQEMCRMLRLGPAETERKMSQPSKRCRNRENIVATEQTLSQPSKHCRNRAKVVETENLSRVSLISVLK